MARSASPRICHAGTATGTDEARSAISRAQALGFSHIILSPGDPLKQSIKELTEQSQAADLALLLDIDISDLPFDHPLVREHPECFSFAAEASSNYIDPRLPNAVQGRAHARPEQNPEPFLSWWSRALSTWLTEGVQGFRLLEPQRCSAQIWRELINRIRNENHQEEIFIADTARLPCEQVLDLKDAGFDFTLSSLPWWNGRASWFLQEQETLWPVAPRIALVEAPDCEAPASAELRRNRLALAAVTGAGVMMPSSFESGMLDGIDLPACVKAMNELVRCEIVPYGALRQLTGEGAPITVLLRAAGTDPRIAASAIAALINPDHTANAEIGASVKAALGEWCEAAGVEPFVGAYDKLAPGEARLFRVRRAKPIVVPAKAPAEDAREAARQSRLVIANVVPCIDNGAYPVKRIAGESVTVTADIFPDGHPVIAAELLYRASDEDGWRRQRMQPLANDRWCASFFLQRIGRHCFAVEAWWDSYGTFARDLAKKRAAGTATALDINEGREFIDSARVRAATPQLAGALAAIVEGFDALPLDDRMRLLLAPETIEAVHRTGARPFSVVSPIHEIETERTAARFSSWYELFPRSATGDPHRHGTFKDVIARLPDIAQMGFDVLYMPPIHPVGHTNRKGKNNALAAAPDDPGSVYAIGSEEGGHTAINPQLGTLADFHALIAAAHEHGMEIALDFAIQCSPDHPWLKEYPGWFDWEPDGSVKYAENPPKKYEDIVNVDFYAKDAVPDLWLALRFVVLFWIEQGVRIFRVDNPHTKPFAFWQWLIADVRGRHPDAIFLSEAFTRPKVMYHLAKLGFSQSYTYFTWRNSKAELTAYIKELTSEPTCEFFRPHFFVNTPDINPPFLQTSGRPGFLIRAALATTLSGLWGMYSGFELCESEPVPGREEYNNSEKYEIKPRDWNAPHNIKAEIAALNRLRRIEPALQSHLGVTFYQAFNDNILYFAKHVTGSTDRILVAISLNPHGPEEAYFEIPLWEWSLPDSGALLARDLLRGGSFVWHGKTQWMRLTPAAPYAIWRIQPAETQ